MSGQWEVIGKKKDRGNKTQSQKVASESKLSNKKKSDLNIKIEDVLAKSQVKNLYANATTEKVNKENKSKTSQQNQNSATGASKKQKNQTNKNEKSPIEKQKQPKTIESALNLIDPEEFRDVYQKSKTQFGDAPIVWLKELSQFLNQKICVEVHDPVFSSKKGNYPYNIVPQPIRNVIEKAVKDAGSSNVQLFFDITLTAMATDMGKNLPSIGHKIFLQYLSLNKPELAITNLIKHKNLLNSYQNRPNIGLSIFWALGQSGFKDFQTGLKVFEVIMLPLIELKNYSKYTVKYLIDLVKSAELATIISPNQFLMIMNIFYTNKKNFPIELKSESQTIASKLKSILFQNDKKENYAAYVDIFIKQLAHTDKSYRDWLCEAIVECFVKDSNNLEVLGVLYNKKIVHGAILFNYMSENWGSISKKLNKKALDEVINAQLFENYHIFLKTCKDKNLREFLLSVKVFEFNNKIKVTKKVFANLYWYLPF